MYAHEESLGTRLLFSSRLHIYITTCSCTTTGSKIHYCVQNTAYMLYGADQPTELYTCLHDLHNLCESVHVFSAGKEPLQHENTKILVHITAWPSHHLQGEHPYARNVVAITSTCIHTLYMYMYIHVYTCMYCVALQLPLRAHMYYTCTCSRT